MYAKDITTNRAKIEAKRLLEVSEEPDNRSLKNFFIVVCFNINTTKKGAFAPFLITNLKLIKQQTQLLTHTI